MAGYHYDLNSLETCTCIYYADVLADKPASQKRHELSNNESKINEIPKVYFPVITPGLSLHEYVHYDIYQCAHKVFISALDCNLAAVLSL